jgi:hypothetical protein
MAERPSYTATGLAHQIESYLRLHPNAADTLEGVSRWWLQDLPGDISPEDVLTALNLLQHQGALRIYTAPGGNRIYAKNYPTRH